MIRFLGYKGVVAVDLALPRSTINMRLRPSMKRFDAEISTTSPVEIVQAFERPNTAYLNRPLIMFLEDRKVPIDSFLQLQAKAIDRARKISTSIDHFVRLSSSYHLGSNFYLLDLLRRIEKEYSPTIQNRIFQLPLFQGLCRVATNVILREIRERARIPIEGSYRLVGVADEGPEYIKKFGWNDVLCLREGEIFACIQTNHNESPVWLQGSATVSRNPLTHPGDVQRVYAIGEPPDDQRCLFKHLRNVVVMPSQGKRPLASCLSGGDLGGDEFSVIMDETLFPQTDVRPADYLPTAPWTLEGSETVKPKHITKFIVQYIESDVLGLLSDKLLLVADQSPDGVFDKKCIQLAEWCSKAINYPKQGIPVQLDFRSLPRPLTPDWYIQDVDPASNTISNANYVCESPRALGCLYREALRLEKLEQVSATAKVPNELRGSGTSHHPITPLLKSKIEDFLGDAVHLSSNRSQSAHIRQLFEHYRVELQYICSMTTLSSLSGDKLEEEEVVLGKILGAGLQKNIREDLQQRMKDNVASLVRNVKRHLLVENSGPGQEEAHPDLFYGLELAWSAWNFSVSKQGEFGSGSFGLIALTTFFHCLDRLG
ncbi:RNA dependent RNA polymerase-domain-containing protein [Crepidotus variabilis]|uniref:RNA-dependent RNA polymerase n=1 Tax=Crepidotus variabilis TaxID=179855 RepID=A0A9P6EDC6_9AGAR|nr:RNA dependent RNA polymerase-domain-containing protein [Crepidotus variabilis]